MHVINVLQHTVGYGPWGHKEADTTKQLLLLLLLLLLTCTMYTSFTFFCHNYH